MMIPRGPRTLFAIAAAIAIAAECFTAGYSTAQPTTSSEAEPPAPAPAKADMPGPQPELIASFCTPMVLAMPMPAPARVTLPGIGEAMVIPRYATPVLASKIFHAAADAGLRAVRDDRTLVLGFKGAVLRPSRVFEVSAGSTAPLPPAP